MSSSFEELLKKAKVLKTKAKSPLVRQRLIAILELLLDLAFDDEDAGPAPAKRARLDTAPPPTTNSNSNSNNNNNNNTPTTNDEDEQMDTSPPKEAKKKPAPKAPKKKNAWVHVKDTRTNSSAAKRTAGAPTQPPATQALQLRQEDWGIPVKVPADFDGDAPPANGVILLPKDATEAERIEWVTRLKGLAKLNGGAYAVLSFRPLSASPKEEHKDPMLFSKGDLTVCRDVYLWYVGVQSTPKLQYAQAEVTDSTTVIHAVVEKKTLSASTVKLLADKKTRDSAMAALVKRATKQLDVVTAHNRIFNLFDYKDQALVSVRVPAERKMDLLRSSGKYGVFWRTTSYVKGGYAEPVFWFKSEATVKDALRVHEAVKSDGVVWSGNRYGLRMSSIDDLPKFRTAGGNLACEPRDEAVQLYEVRGASSTEEADDVMRSLRTQWECASRKTYRSGRFLVIIVESTTAPQWSVFRRGSKSSLHVTPCTKEALRNKKSKAMKFIGTVRKQKVTLSMEDFPPLSPDPTNTIRGVKRSASGQPAPTPTPATADAPTSIFQRLGTAMFSLSRSRDREDMKEDVDLPDADSSGGEEEDAHVHDWTQAGTVLVKATDATCACCTSSIPVSHGAKKCPGCDALICATCFGNSQ